MKKPKAVESAKVTLEDANAPMSVVENGRQLTIQELRQRASDSDDELAEFYALAADVNEGKVTIMNPARDPLPKWKMEGNGLGSMKRQSVGYTCDDPGAQAFALAVMNMTGFSIPDFDVWLDSIGFCGARTELMVRRRWVADALCADNEDGVRRHLEWLSNRRREIQDKMVLVPLAQRDEKRQAGTRKERRPDITAWIDAQLARNPAAKSPALWSVAPEWLTDEIGSRRFATRVTKSRKKRASK